MFHSISFFICIDNVFYVVCTVFIMLFVFVTQKRKSSFIWFETVVNQKQKGMNVKSADTLNASLGSRIPKSIFDKIQKQIK